MHKHRSHSSVLDRCRHSVGVLIEKGTSSAATVWRARIRHRVQDKSVWRSNAQRPRLSRRKSPILSTFFGEIQQRSGGKRPTSENRNAAPIAAASRNSGPRYKSTRRCLTRLSDQPSLLSRNVMALFGAIRAWNCSAANLGTHWADFGNVEPNPNRTMLWSGRRCYPLDC